MATEPILAMIKSDGVRKNVGGKINTLFEDDGLNVVAARVMNVSNPWTSPPCFVHGEPSGALLIRMSMSACVQRPWRSRAFTVTMRSQYLLES